MAEQNNELLMKNYEAHPTSSAPFLEVNVVTHHKFKREQNHGRGRGRGRGHKKYSHRGSHNKKCSLHQKWNNSTKQEKNKGAPSNPSKSVDNLCY